MELDSLIKHFTGTKEQFIAAGFDTTYANYVVFIGNGSVGSYIFCKGEYHGGAETVIQAMNYFSQITVSGKTASANGPNSVIAIDSKDPTMLDISVDEKGLHFALTENFKTHINTTLPNRITAVENSITTLQGTGAGSIEAMIAAAIAAIIANAPEDFDTLKEIADYIASDKTNAANMNNAITANTTAINEIKAAWTIEEI